MSKKRPDRLSVQAIKGSESVMLWVDDGSVGLTVTLSGADAVDLANNLRCAATQVGVSVETAFGIKTS
jgi:hypothetical protein